MIGRMVEKILIVGSGFTGAVISSLLRENIGKYASISVWDKCLDIGNGIGGRMSTSRSKRDKQCTVDLGAQYISITPAHKKKQLQFYHELLEAGILEPLSGEIVGHQDREPGTEHYVTPAGISSLVNFYLNKSGAQFEAGNTVTDLSMEVPDKVKVTTDCGKSETFDAVVMTMPAPLVLQLGPGVHALIADHDRLRSKLEEVTYSSRFAVGLFYPPGTKLDYPWSATYVTDNSCIRFVSIDTRKRHVELPNTGPSICVHTNVPWGLANVDRPTDEAIDEILQHLSTALPDLPQPVEVIGHKWRYSQVHKSFEGSHGCVLLSEKPLVILAGDTFTDSTFYGCVRSATTASNKLTSLLLNH